MSQSHHWEWLYSRLLWSRHHTLTSRSHLPVPSTSSVSLPLTSHDDTPVSTRPTGTETRLESTDQVVSGPLTLNLSICVYQSWLHVNFVYFISFIPGNRLRDPSFLLIPLVNCGRSAIVPSVVIYSLFKTTNLMERNSQERSWKELSVRKRKSITV